MDLHRLFDEWLAAGAEGEPGRDLALHASGCEECLRAIAAMDSLQAIDVGAAPPPPSMRVSSGSRPGSGPGGAGYVAGVIAAVLVGIGFAVGASGLFPLRDAGTGTEDTGLRSPAGEVLGGGPSDRASLEPASEDPSPSPSPTPSPTAEPSPSEEATAAPVVAPPPAPLVTPAPQPLPQPTPAPTAAPTVAPSTPAPTPTAAPTATASPVPTLAACFNLIDDDGDQLIDFPADPGCTGIDDDSEVDPEPTP